MKTSTCLLLSLLASLPLKAADQIVSNNSDSGSGSLRQAIIDVGPGENISFAPSLSGNTILLTGQLAIGKSLTIDASALPDGITLDADGLVTGDRVFEIDNNATVELRRLTMVNGHVANSNGSGGAVEVKLGSTLTIHQSTIAHNTAYHGGGLANSGTLTLHNCTVSNNTTLLQDGGGLHNFQGTVTLNNVTITGNHAGDKAGGIINYQGTMTLQNITLIGNTADHSGDGIWNNSTLHCNNSILADAMIGSITAGSNNHTIGDPMLSPLGDHGGPTRTMPPLPGSPVINAGGSALLETDQRGFPRLRSFAVDIGAVEYQRVRYVDAGASAGNPDGSSWTKAYPTLQDALATAVPGDFISIAAGTYYPDEGSGQTDNDRSSTFTLIDNVVLYGGYPGGGGPRNPKAHPTILSGDIDQNDSPGFVNNSLNAKAVVSANGLPAPVYSTTILDGLTITAGNGDFGGGFNGVDVEPIFRNCLFQGNMALQGGGVALTESRSTFINCSFLGNHGNYGGGASTDRNSNGTFTNCLFQGNTSLNLGGGVYNTRSEGSFTNCVFAGNIATEGGGFFNDGTSHITNCTFQGNRATDFGGGIYNMANSPAFMTNCLIWNNEASGTTTSPGASVFGSNTPVFSFCLVQNWDKASLDVATNPDTNFAPADPFFVKPITPGNTSATDGDLRLFSDSPGLDAGTNSANSELFDLSGNARIQNTTIDLGAHEGAQPRPPVTYVDADATGTGDGTSWANAYPKLQDALAAGYVAEAIWVAEGNYYPDEGNGQTNDHRESTFNLAAHLALYGGFEGTESSLAERDPAAHPTILSGDIGTIGLASDNAHHVLTIDGTSSTIDSATILDGFSIIAGKANGSSEDSRGGGIYLKSASPTIANCALSGNSAFTGGGVYSGQGASPAFDSCSFSGNSSNSDGGGIYLEDLPVTFNNCFFLDNSADDYGGGIYNGSPSPTLTNCSFRGNSASRGGGIYNVDNTCPTLTNCSLSGNRAYDHGGGIYLSYTSEIPGPFTNCTFSGNYAGSDGGGIYNTNSALTLVNSLIWNNRDSSGTTTAKASLYHHSFNSTSYRHCLIENYSKSTLDRGVIPGTNFNPSDPLFALPPDPATAPTTSGDLRLLSSSPALNAGDNAVIVPGTDLTGNPRMVGTIDLGAYEGSFVTFAHLGYSNPNGDDNGNGFANFLEYAAGGDPTAPHNPSLFPSASQGQYHFSFRNNAADLSFFLQKSTTIQAGSWINMVEDVDFTINNDLINSEKTKRTIDLLSPLTNEDHLFFRLGFSSGG